MIAAKEIIRVDRGDVVSPALGDDLLRRNVQQRHDLEADNIDEDALFLHHGIKDKNSYFKNTSVAPATSNMKSAVPGKNFRTTAPSDEAYPAQEKNRAVLPSKKTSRVIGEKHTREEEDAREGIVKIRPTTATTSLAIPALADDGSSDDEHFVDVDAPAKNPTSHANRKKRSDAGKCEKKSRKI